MSAPKAPSHRLHAEERRRQLLETALDFFSRRGFGGTTTKEIAAAAGVTEAIVFRHFPSKQALYQAVLDNCHESPEMLEWLAQTKTCMEQNDDAGLLREIARKILETHRRDSRLHRVLLFAALEGHEQGLAHHRQISIPVYSQLCQYIQRRQREGKLLDYDCGIILVAIAGMASHFATMTEMFGFESNVPDDQAVEIFTSILMTGIQPRKEQARK
ncbi:MAG TPA: TetR/AcrR family transcriptional regulator [Candidatus Sulfopaludibacter sp.]|jgi:TetR/AcrR family transcriptional regulator|nr:TetR/AcrR family transcriptional regulator [Candidatus Sulfopaludibacter sp.]